MRYASGRIRMNSRCTLIFKGELDRINRIYRRAGPGAGSLILFIPVNPVCFYLRNEIV
jgi:hypothetical protein